MKKILYICMIAMFMLAACGGANANSIVGEWELVSYGPTSSQTAAASVDFDTFINFDENGGLAGNVGCNSFGGDYEVSGDQIIFGSIISTLMACEEPIGSQEAVVLKTFTGTASYTLSGGTLTITSEDGTTSVVLARQ